MPQVCYYGRSIVAAGSDHACSLLSECVEAEALVIGRVCRVWYMQSPREGWTILRGDCPYSEMLLRTVSHTRWRPAMDNGAKAQTLLGRHGRNDGVHGDLIG